MTEKTIDTLVEDIYGLFTKENKEETKINKEDLDTFTNAVATIVTSYLSKNRDKKNNLRLSIIGKPSRQIYYDLKNENPEQLDAPTQIKFLYGSLIEELLILLIKVSGHRVSALQKEFDIDGVKGHHDFLVDDVLTDAKSASKYSYNKFATGALYKKGNDPFGYIAQLSAYARANEVDKAGFLVLNKESGELCFSKLHHIDMINPEEKIKEIKEFLNKDVPPTRCYSPVPDGVSGNLVLAIGCNYCPHKFTCWADSNNGKGLRTFKYSNGNKSFIQVVKEPNVEEIR